MKTGKSAMKKYFLYEMRVCIPMSAVGFKVNHGLYYHDPWNSVLLEIDRKYVSRYVN